MRKHSENSSNKFMSSGKNLREVFASRSDGIVALKSSEKPLESILAVIEKQTLPLESGPVIKKEYLETSIPTNILYIEQPPMVLNLGKPGKAFRPILHVDKDSELQSTYHGYGRKGTDSFAGSMAQVKWSSPAFPFVMGSYPIHINFITQILSRSVKWAKNIRHVVSQKPKRKASSQEFNVIFVGLVPGVL